MGNREEIIKKLKEEFMKKPKPYTDEWYADVKEKFDMMKPFTRVDDLPDVPVFKDYGKYKEIVVKNLIRCGAIPKDELIVGKAYVGGCRNTTEATWDGNEFKYTRNKFGVLFEDNIKHFEDDTCYDVFIPIKEKKTI
jgi:hypothetical protein